MQEILESSGFALGPLATTFLIGLAAFILLLLYSIQKQTYWKKQGIPYVKPIPFLGSSSDGVKSLDQIELERYRKYGRLYGHYEGSRPVLSIAEPDILRNVFVKDFQAFPNRRSIATGDKIIDNMVAVLEGEAWKRVRSIMSPTFTTGKIKRVVNIFRDCSKTLVDNFKQAAEKEQPVDVKEIYGAFSMDVIASSAFSTKIDSHNDPNNDFVKNAKSVFPRNISWRLVLLAYFPSLMKLFKISVFPPAGLNFFRIVTLQIIKERRRTGQKRNDFLQLLLDTAEDLSREADDKEKDVTLENYGKDENNQALSSTTSVNKTLSYDELIAQCVGFFQGAYDTTGSALSFVSYCLATNPCIQEKVIEELDKVSRENNGILTYEAIQEMKYLDNVISETMRLYPAVIRLERLADMNYKLEGTGLTIPKGMIVTIPTYAIHRDPEFYPDPEKFDPDRFTPEERAKRSPYVYLPFGAGPRNCVGMRFALIEMKVCLAYVLRNFRFKTCPETKVPLEFCLGQGLLLPKEVKLALEIRKDATC